MNWHSKNTGYIFIPDHTSQSESRLSTHRSHEWYSWKEVGIEITAGFEKKANFVFVLCTYVQFGRTIEMEGDCLGKIFGSEEIIRQWI